MKKPGAVKLPAVNLATYEPADAASKVWVPFENAIALTSDWVCGAVAPAGPVVGQVDTTPE